jgi:hypothetical protein
MPHIVVRNQTPNKVIPKIPLPHSRPPICSVGFAAPFLHLGLDVFFFCLFRLGFPVTVAPLSLLLFTNLIPSTKPSSESTDTWAVAFLLGFVRLRGGRATAQLRWAFRDATGVVIPKPPARRHKDVY